MTLEMIVYTNGEAHLIFNYIRENNLEIDSVRLIDNPEGARDTMLVYVWCTPYQKEVLINLKNLDEGV